MYTIHEMQKRKLIILGGASAVGKTTTGRKLQLALGRPAHNMDMDWHVDFLLPNRKSFFKASTEEYIVQCFLVEKFLCEALGKRMFNENENPLIASSAHIIPGFIRTDTKIDPRIDTHQILLTTNEDELYERLHKRTIERDRRQHMHDNLEANADKTIKFQRLLIDIAKARGVQSIENDEHAIKNIIESVGLGNA